MCLSCFLRSVDAGLVTRAIVLVLNKQVLLTSAFDVGWLRWVSGGVGGVLLRARSSFETPSL